MGKPQKPAQRQAVRARRTEAILSARNRYAELERADKSRLVDELVTVTGYHRKSVLRLLRSREPEPNSLDRERSADGRLNRPRPRLYGTEVVDALVVLWEASDRLCGKRLHALLPTLVPALERHGHLSLEPAIREKVLQVSAATIDRLLQPTRAEVGGERPRRRQRLRNSVRQRVKVRTFNGWQGVEPGWMEMDLVAHCGGRLNGQFHWTLVITDIASGWTECLPLMARDGALVRVALDEVVKLLPIPLRGLDTDNDSVFMNESLEQWCRAHGVELTRSRAYESNDQAWVEQKNGALVRRVVGHQRLQGHQNLQVLCRLYGALRLFNNVYQPSAKRLPWQESDLRRGSKPRRRHDLPQTPANRLLAWGDLSAEGRTAIEQLQQHCDPIALLETIRVAQGELMSGAQGDASMTDADLRTGSGQDTSLDEFLVSLRLLWNQQVPVMESGTQTRPRTWRTRKDPFADHWEQIEQWLATEPELTAASVLRRLQETSPGQFNAQLRTLQRRIQQWRIDHARSVLSQQLQSLSAKRADLEAVVDVN